MNEPPSPLPVPSSSMDRLVPWIAGLVVALPVFACGYPAMADVPMHEAIVGILRHWGDPAYVPVGVYELNLGLGNQLVYALMLPLAFALPMGMVTRLVAAATLLLLPVGTARAADRLGVSRASAVLTAPIALGWLFYWGLIGNLVGLVALLFALPAIDRLAERPTRRRVLSVCAWMVLLHFAHDLMALCAAILLFVLSVTRPREWPWRATLARALPAALAVALVTSTTILAGRHLGARHQRMHGFVWWGPWEKITSIPRVLYGGVGGELRSIVFGVCALTMAMFAFDRVRTWRASSTRAPLRRELRMGVAGLALLAVYFAAPQNVGSTTLIFERFLAPAWILLTLAISPPRDAPNPWRLPRIVAVAAPLAPVLLSFPTWLQNGRLYADLDALLPSLATGSSYLIVELGPGDTSGLVPPVNAVGHMVGALGGRSFMDFTTSEIAPVFQPPHKQWNEIIDRMNGHPYEMIPSLDLTRFRYALLHTTDVGLANLAAVALSPDARMIDRQGEWTVMESTLPRVPIDSPDTPTPLVAPGRTLRERCIAVSASLRQGPP